MLVLDSKTEVFDFDGTNQQMLAPSYPGFIPNFDREYAEVYGVPFAFLPLFSPRVLLFALPIVAINLLSIRDTQFDYKSHYSALLLFPLAVGSIYGTANLVEILKKWRFTASHAPRAVIPIALWS